MSENTLVINQTKHWLSTVIIEHSICPFAKREFDRDRIHYEIIVSDDLSTQLEHLILQCEFLDNKNNDSEIETSLLIFPTALKDFEDYLDVLEIATELMTKQGYEGVYQLASFHPDYCFAGANPNDASNYTNRSPYPMLHILREDSIEKALENYPNPESIPERNIQLTKDLGLEQMKNTLAECYQII